MEIGEMIKYLRDERGMSQEVLGTRSGIDQRQISRWERGEVEPKVSSLRKIAEAMEVSIRSFLDPDEYATYSILRRIEIMNERGYTVEFRGTDGEEDNGVAYKVAVTKPSGDGDRLWAKGSLINKEGNYLDYLSKTLMASERMIEEKIKEADKK